MDVIDLTDDREETELVQNLWIIYKKSFLRVTEEDPIMKLTIPNLTNRVMIRFLTPLSKATDFVSEILNLCKVQMPPSERRQFINSHSLTVVYMRAIIGLRANESHLTKYEKFLNDCRLGEFLEPMRSLSIYFKTKNLGQTEMIMMCILALIHDFDCKPCSSPSLQQFLREVWQLWPSNLLPRDVTNEKIRYLRSVIASHDSKIHVLCLDEACVNDVCQFIDNIFDPYLCAAV